MSLDVLRVQRDPRAETRTRQSLDVIALILNSLIDSGAIVQAAGNTFIINTTTGDNILANQIFGD